MREIFSAFAVALVEVLLEFLKVIITANLFLASLTNCQTSRDSAQDVTQAEHRADANRSSRGGKKVTL